MRKKPNKANASKVDAKAQPVNGKGVVGHDVCVSSKPAQAKDGYFIFNSHKEAHDYCYDNILTEDIADTLMSIYQSKFSKYPSCNLLEEDPFQLGTTGVYVSSKVNITGGAVVIKPIFLMPYYCGNELCYSYADIEDFNGPILTVDYTIIPIKIINYYEIVRSIPNTGNPLNAVVHFIRNMVNLL